MKSDDWAGILAGCLGTLLIILIVAVVGAYLVQTVVGYFGVSLTLWQGFVTSFTVSWLFGSKSSK